ncbi:hypothetical protein ACFXB4_35850 [Streptomyces lavendulae]|uniref:hypothetical protein n=1 Tax=Streptomyces lavendulae TaxID=1914 RepID=UPI00367934F4
MRLRIAFAAALATAALLTSIGTAVADGNYETVVGNQYVGGQAIQLSAEDN